MGTESIISGYIRTAGENFMEQNRRAIAEYPFDNVWPFRNIFWSDSPARYGYPVIGFAGSYKQVEEVWSEWLWKLSQLLSRLEAIDARVSLDCLIGHFCWRLEPRSMYQRLPRPGTWVSECWGITEAPEQDFSIDPEWLGQTERNLSTWDTDTGDWMSYKWDRFVERWPART
jgi:hypothetical protein